jgi:hypothetical protein
MYIEFRKRRYPLLKHVGFFLLQALAFIRIIPTHYASTVISFELEGKQNAINRL